MLDLVLGRILPWLFVIPGYWLVFQLIRQNGRILLRLEALEAKLEPLREAKPANRRAGLAVGAEAPAFGLADLDGQRRSLDEFRGRQVLAIFFNPACGFCARMAPELAAFAARGDNDGAGPVPLLITTGDATANRRLFDRHKVNGPVLLQETTEVATRYRTRSTPSGYLIDAQGRIASELTEGAPGLMALLQHPAGPQRLQTDPDTNAGQGDCGCGKPARAGHAKTNKGLAASKLNRSGLKSGTPAPAFRLPRLEGGELSLQDYRGRRVLLVFSDPACGPCEQVARRLEHIHRDRHDLAVLMISRRDPEANRRKVEALGMTFPVVLQTNWEISRLYAMFATPIGYLIDEHGVLAADVAVGIEPILALASLSEGVPLPADGQPAAPSNGLAPASVRNSS